MDYSNSRITRRSFIGGVAAATALAVSTGRVAHASPTPTSIRDVVIVGAGFAGITAARELRRAGLAPTIIEARGRIGGRVFTRDFGGEQIELGAQWIAPTQLYATAELNRYGIGLNPIPDALPERAFYPSNSGAQPVDFIEASGHMGALYSNVFADTRKWFPNPYDPLAGGTSVLAADKLSLGQKVLQVANNPKDRLWLESSFYGYCGESIFRRGLTSMGQWWALGGHTIAGWDQQTSLTPVGGMTSLLDKIFQESSSELILNNPVSAVTKRDGYVEIVGQKVTIRAKRVVIATPANIWKSIRFAPALPPAFSLASNYGLGIPSLSKVFFRTPGDQGRVFAQGSASDPLGLVLPLTTFENGDILSVGFATDPQYPTYGLARSQEALNRIAPGVKLLDQAVGAWAADPFSQGAWGMRGPNMIGLVARELQTSFGPITFATGDIAPGWNGAYIDGAIESGFAAARKVVNG